MLNGNNVFSTRLFRKKRSTVAGFWNPTHFFLCFTWVFDFSIWKYQKTSKEWSMNFVLTFTDFQTLPRTLSTVFPYHLQRGRGLSMIPISLKTGNVSVFKFTCVYCEYQLKIPSGYVLVVSSILLRPAVSSNNLHL